MFARPAYKLGMLLSRQPDIPPPNNRHSRDQPSFPRRRESQGWGFPARNAGHLQAALFPARERKWNILRGNDGCGVSRRRGSATHVWGRLSPRESTDVWGGCVLGMAPVPACAGTTGGASRGWGCPPFPLRGPLPTVASPWDSRRHSRRPRSIPAKAGIDQVSGGSLPSNETGHLRHAVNPATGGYLQHVSFRTGTTDALPLTGAACWGWVTSRLRGNDGCLEACPRVDGMRFPPGERVTNRHSRDQPSLSREGGNPGLGVP